MSLYFNLQKSYAERETNSGKSQNIQSGTRKRRATPTQCEIKTKKLKTTSQK